MKLLYNIRIKFPVAVLLFGFCLYLLSCSDEKDVYVPGLKGDPATVTLTIRTPSSSLPKSSLKGTPGIESENSIDRIKVMVFIKQGGTYYYDYMVDGQEIIQNTSNNTTTFTALLTASDDPVKLLLVANYNDAYQNNPPHHGDTEEDVRSTLADTFEEVLTKDLPMYGEAELTQLKTDQYNNISVTMLRAVARVDVVDEINPEYSAPFTMKEVYIFRPNNSLRLIPDESAMSGTGTPVTAASIPASSSATGFLPYEVEADGSQASMMYVSESLPVTNSVSDQILTSTCVVVGGLYDDDTEISYYRIDFDSGLDGHPFGQILRNYRYIFNIKQVNMQGWETPKDAAENAPSSIVATMQIWNEVTSEMYFSGNDNYLGISSRHIQLNYTKGAKENVYLQTTVPYKVQAVAADGTLIGNPITTVGESFENEFFQLEIKTHTSSEGKDMYDLLITSLGENRTDNSFSGYFQVFTDFWTFDVEVEQLSYKGFYTDKILHVLTITNTRGDLGTADGIFTEGSGTACRQILENKANFSPDGTMPVGGIVVFDLLNSTISSTTSASMYILEKTLKSVEVVHLPGGSTPSVQASELIYNWLTENQERVLILGMDDSKTNANLKDYFDTDGQWYEAFLEESQKTTVSEIGISFIEEGSEPFYDGPFGKLADGMNFGYVDGIMGYSDGYNWETTVPLLRVTGGDNLSGMMTHGVNRDLGVIYFGESKITTSNGSAMSQAALESGTVTNNCDILLGNIWAWIIERAFGNRPFEALY